MSELELPNKIALTGGASFLGTLILKRLAEIPTVHEVHIFDVAPPQVASPKFNFHRLDLTKDSASPELANQLQRNGIETFIHGALFTGPGRTFNREVESIGTFHVLNACAEANVKKLLVNSATFVYGATSQNPNFLLETMPLRSQGPLFVRTRVDVEKQVSEFAKDYPACAVTVLRFPPILGPNSTNVRARYFLAGFIPKVLGHDPLLQFIHEEDAVRAALSALAQSTSGVFNIVGRGVLPLSTAIHLSGRLPLPVFRTICKSVFRLGFLTRVWDLEPGLVPFFQYLCVADGRRAEQHLRFRAKFSSRQALKSMLEAYRLRSVGFSMPSSVLGEEEELARETAFERVY